MTGDTIKVNLYIELDTASLNKCFTCVSATNENWETCNKKIFLSLTDGEHNEQENVKLFDAKEYSVVF